MRVLLGKADPPTARFTAQALREHAYAVDVAADRQGVLAACSGVEYAAVLLHSDLCRAGADHPLALARELRARQVRAPLLLLQAVPLPPVEGGLVTGAKLEPADVLIEPFSLTLLRSRLRRLIRQSMAAPANAPGEPIGWAGLALDPRTRCALRDCQEVPLTRKEYALLELLLLRAPRPVSHADIVAHVWDGEFDCDSNLIEVYMARLRRRLDRTGAEKLLHTVRGVGYRVGAAEA